MKTNSPNFPPKEGGWGWFVVTGAGLSAFLIGGFVRTFSIIFEEVRHKFGSSASATAWVYSLNVTMSLMSGPISTMLSTRFSVRAVGMVGSLLMFLGFLASAYAPSLPYLYVAYAVVGVGQGFIITPIFLIMSQWFDKRRARATSIALMTDGFGALAMAPLFQFLLDYYGYTGTMLIITGLMTNNFVAVALFREPDKLDYTNNTDVTKSLMTTENTNDQTEAEIKDSYEDQESTETSGSDSVNAHLQSSNSNSTIKIQNNHTEGSVATKEVCDDVPDLMEHDHNKGCTQKISKYFDFHLLRNGLYLTFSLLMLCASLCISMCNTHIAGLAEESKLSLSQVSLLISLMGAFSIVAKFLSGFLFDYSEVRKFRIHLFSAFGLVIGASLLLSPWIHEIIGFYILWLTYITAMAVFTTQESVILADIVGRDRFSGALGLNRFFRGIGVLIGPTVGGALKDYTGVYEYTFIFGGLCLVVAALLFEFSAIVIHRRKNKA